MFRKCINSTILAPKMQKILDFCRWMSALLGASLQYRPPGTPQGPPQGPPPEGVEKNPVPKNPGPKKPRSQKTPVPKKPKPKKTHCIVWAWGQKKPATKRGPKKGLARLWRLRAPRDANLYRFVDRKGSPKGVPMGSLDDHWDRV